MNAPARRQRIAAEAAARLALLHQVAEATVELANEAAGETILVRRARSVCDARRPDVDRMTVQARAWLEAAKVIDRWMLPGSDPRTLGSLLKVLPADEVALLRGHLAAAGVLPDDDGGEQR